MAKLRCFLHYFERTMEAGLERQGSIVFHRQVRAVLCTAGCLFSFSMVSVLLNNDRDHIERCSLRFLQSPLCAVNCLQRVRSSGQGGVVCKSCSTHRVLISCNLLQHSAKGQLSF